MADFKIFMVLATILLFAIIGTIISKKLKQPVSVGIIVFTSFLTTVITLVMLKYLYNTKGGRA